MEGRPLPRPPQCQHPAATFRSAPSCLSFQPRPPRSQPTVASIVRSGSTVFHLSSSAPPRLCASQGTVWCFNPRNFQVCSLLLQVSAPSDLKSLFLQVLTPHFSLCSFFLEQSDDRLHLCNFPLRYFPYAAHLSPVPLALFPSLRSPATNGGSVLGRGLSCFCDLFLNIKLE